MRIILLNDNAKVLLFFLTPKNCLIYLSSIASMVRLSQPFGLSWQAKSTVSARGRDRLANHEKTSGKPAMRTEQAVLCRAKQPFWHFRSKFFAEKSHNTE